MPGIWGENRERDFMNTLTKFSLSLIFSVLFLGSCDNTDPEDQIPLTLVNETINLTNQQYQNLQFIGGHVTISGGVRGIIIYRVSTTEYRAIEANCSFEPLNSCAQVEPESSGLFLIDNCCTSTFNFDGFPTGGPATLPLRLYNTSLQGTFLTITN